MEIGFVEGEMTTQEHLHLINMKKIKKPKGFGDTVHNVIQTISRGKVKPCGGCKKRQTMLNQLISYNKK